ncbi:hypothetical protein K7472_19375 [Streptomyces sp. PTM05]|uniref:Uncharacterized protein n=1 Tax=Streptantibioticus parmotrematis TaxID=2873249 RepID=A0ABS7QWB8_9ACTN|nr:hypothetical protein [Streptantibioticus parmotrematis]MBY8886996.1 hypothetical protein [Streptantibioticus parmotrematis]
MTAQQGTDEMLQISRQAEECREGAVLRSLLRDAEVLYAAAWYELNQELQAAHTYNTTATERQEPCGTQQGAAWIDVSDLVESTLEATPLGMAYRSIVMTVWQRSSSGLAGGRGGRP